MIVKILNQSQNPTPRYETLGAAGLDIRANIDAVIHTSTRMLIPTGLFLEISMGYEGQIRPRSGLALKHGITVLNSPGTIDSDYRGEIGLILINHGEAPFVVKKGERLAQMVFKAYEKAELEEVLILNESSRGTRGFGSTGV